MLITHPFIFQILFTTLVSISTSASISSSSEIQNRKRSVFELSDVFSVEAKNMRIEASAHADINQDPLILTTTTTTTQDTADKFKLTDLPNPIFFNIASFLEMPFREMGFINIHLSKIFFKDIPLRHRIAFMYSKARIMPEMAVSTSKFTSDHDLPWFLQSGRVPRKSLFQNRYFLQIITMALTYNSYFPYNGKYISKLILEAVIEKGDREYFLHKTFRFIDSSIILTLSGYFRKTCQYRLLVKLLDEFPEIGFEFYDQNTKSKFERIYISIKSSESTENEARLNLEKLKLTVKERPPIEPKPNQGTSTCSERFNLYAADTMTKMRNITSSTSINAQNSYTEFQKGLCCLLGEMRKDFINSNSEFRAEDRAHFQVLFVKVLLSALDVVCSVWSDEILAAFIKHYMRVELFRFLGQLNSLKSGPELILRVYRNPELHQFFKDFIVQIGPNYILSVIRSPEHLVQFKSLFSQYGRLIGFIYFDILQHLIPDFEYQAFQDFTGLDLSTCLTKKYSKCENSVSFWTAKMITEFFFQHRSLFLYCLQHGNLVEIGWNTFSINIFICIRRDSPKSRKALLQSFKNMFEANKSSETFPLSSFNKIYREIFINNVSDSESDSDSDFENGSEAEELMEYESESEPDFDFDFESEFESEVDSENGGPEADDLIE